MRRPPLPQTILSRLICKTSLWDREEPRIAYELVFPLYAHFISPAHTYGAIAGLLVILLLFFSYFAVILLLGAEINSWHLGHTETSGDIATTLSQSDTWKQQRQPMSQERPGA